MCVVALAILPSALLTLFLARETKQSYRQAVLQDAGRRMELVDQAFQRTLETVQEDVDFLSTSPLYAESRGQLRRYFDASADAADSPLQAEIKAELDRFVVSRALISSAYFGASDGGFRRQPAGKRARAELRSAPTAMVSIGSRGPARH